MWATRSRSGGSPEAAVAIVASLLIGGGVWGELFFAERARAADDSRVAEAEMALAEAIERAAKLEKEAAEARGRVADIERLTAWRRVSNEQLSQVAVSIRPVASEIDLWVEYERTDPESFLYATELMKIFLEAGIKGLRHSASSGFLVGGFSLGVHMSASPDIPGSFIASEFGKAKIPIRLSSDDLSGHLPRDDHPNLYIFVGPKVPAGFSLWEEFTAARSIPPPTNAAARE